MTRLLLLHLLLLLKLLFNLLPSFHLSKDSIDTSSLLPRPYLLRHPSCLFCLFKLLKSAHNKAKHALVSMVKNGNPDALTQYIPYMEIYSYTTNKQCISPLNCKCGHFKPGRHSHKQGHLMLSSLAPGA